MKASKRKVKQGRKTYRSKDQLPESEIEMDEPEIVAENERRAGEAEEYGV